MREARDNVFWCDTSSRERNGMIFAIGGPVFGCEHRLECSASSL